MKLFSELNKPKKIDENCTTADCNPGNSMALGVTNHLTPVQNIVTNVRNLFAVLPVVAAVAEDGFSIKLSSSQFTSSENINKLMYEPVFQHQSLYSYIASQGLNKMVAVNLGAFMVVYMSPSDIRAAAPGMEPASCECPCKEDYEMVDIEPMVTEAEGDDEEIEVLTKKHIKEILKAKDKVKSAKQLGILVAQQISLPQEYYFAGVKSSDGEESIALRWKYIKRRAHKKSTEMTHSLMNIFGVGDEAVWVGDFDKKANFQLPDEVKKLIESILELIGAEKTSDPCVFSIADGDKKKDKEEDKKDNNAEEDGEDDNSRGEDTSSEDNDKKEAEDLLS